MSEHQQLPDDLAKAVKFARRIENARFSALFVQTFGEDIFNDLDAVIQHRDGSKAEPPVVRMSWDDIQIDVSHRYGDEWEIWVNRLSDGEEENRPIRTLGPDEIPLKSVVTPQQMQYACLLAEIKTIYLWMLNRPKKDH